jgi:hypothetical protein
MKVGNPDPVEVAPISCEVKPPEVGHVFAVIQAGCLGLFQEMKNPLRGAAEQAVVGV